MRQAAIAAAVIALVGQAHAASKPTTVSADRRVQEVVYMANDVIEVSVVAGVSTHIILAMDENMIDKPLLGDPAAVDYYNTGNHVWVKPKASGGSNMSIVTDKRSYNFDLVYTTNRSRAVYQLTVQYPDMQARELLERARAATMAERMAEPPAPDNHSYSVTTDAGIDVVDVWDDGLRTSFKFKGEVPVIFAVDAAGNPYVVARTMEGVDTAVVHTVAQRWILRLGEGVVRGVVNDAYEQGRASAASGTVSPGVKRVLRDDVR